MLHALAAYVLLNLVLFLFCLWRNRHYTGEPDVESAVVGHASLSSAEWSFVLRHHCSARQCPEMRSAVGPPPASSPCQVCAAVYLEHNWERLAGRERVRAA